MLSPPTTKIVLQSGTSPRSSENVCQTLNCSREAIILHQIWYNGALSIRHHNRHKCVQSAASRAQHAVRQKFKWLYKSHFSADLHQIWYICVLSHGDHNLLDGMEFLYGLMNLIFHSIEEWNYPEKQNRPQFRIRARARACVQSKCVARASAKAT